MKNPIKHYLKPFIYVDLIFQTASISIIFLFRINLDKPYFFI